jgi:ArsR family transcriptional regulator
MGNLSQHLAMMRERCILSSRKAGNQVYYRVANPKLLKACDLLRDILLEQIEKESRLLISKRTTARR